jgi:hypothetical protein
MKPLAALLVLSSFAVAAEPNTLTEEERVDGWLLLFNGQNAEGWICNTGEEPADTVVEEGTLVPYKSGGSVLMYEKPFGDFVLKCEVKTPEKCNSGIFFRIGDPKNPVQTGFEVQVITDDKVSKNGWASIYDLVPPTEVNRKPAGEWNELVITCKGPHVSVASNGKVVAELNADEWTEPGQRLDGSKHKFKAAIKDFPRKGHLGFQDHGAKVWYRNVKLKPL